MPCKNCGFKSCRCYESSDLDSEGEDIFYSSGEDYNSSDDSSDEDYSSSDDSSDFSSTEDYSSSDDSSDLSSTEDYSSSDDSSGISSNEDYVYSSSDDDEHVREHVRLADMKW